MTTGTSIRAAAVAVLAVAAWTVPYGAGRAGASELAVHELQPQPIVGGGDFESRSIVLGKGKSIVVDFPRDIKDVLVADPKTANAVIRSSRRAYIIANATGGTNIVFFDVQGIQMARFDIAVAPDVGVIRTAIQKLIPGADVNVEAIGDGVMLTGTVSSQAEAQLACDVASHFVAGDSFASGGSTNSSGSNGSSPSGGTAVMVTASSSNSNSGGGSGGSPSSCKLDKVVNAIVVRGRDQIMLKVTVAEVERDLIKQLGINLSGSLGYGAAVVNFNNNNPFTAYGQSLSGSSIAAGWKSITGTLQAMEQAGVIHTLAEPTLTAISGEKATFFAGGQFPVLNGFSCNAPASTPGVAGPSTCQPSIQFKNFGVALNFMPVVLSGGRISLNVTTDVSDLSTTNALNIPIPGSTEVGDRAIDPRAQRQHHGRNSLRWRAGAGRHDPEYDKAEHQRPARTDGASRSRRIVQEPRLHQPADGTDDPGDALRRARGRAEGPVAARRRFCRSQRSGERAAWSA